MPLADADLDQRPPGSVSWFALLTAAVVLALLPAFPLTLDGAWHLFSGDADDPALGDTWAVVRLGAGVAPFIAAAVAPLVARVFTTSWGRAFKSAALVVFVLDAFAWWMAMVNAAV